MGMKTLSEVGFREYLSERSKYLFSVANHLPKHQLYYKRLTRPLLGRLLFQAMEVEELLDAFGAKNNRQWRHYRHLVATTKLFSQIGYELLHIQHSLPSYRLVAVEEDFPGAINEMLAFANYTVLRSSIELIQEAGRLGLHVPLDETALDVYKETLPVGRLVHDVETRKINNVYETVTMLATAFLNLAEESRVLKGLYMPDPDECWYFVSDVASHKHLSHLHEQYHNLQSLYDTYVSDTDAENLDSDLAVLRGHISVVTHLLSIASALSHYYERHVRIHDDPTQTDIPLVNAEELLHVMIHYTIGFSVVYTIAARTLCQSMLRRYVDETVMYVSAPVYRGFHVRPSTLAASIVQHYGTDVRMTLADEEVNVGIPLELFRINEKINAEKRRTLARRMTELYNASHGHITQEPHAEATCVCANAYQEAWTKSPEPSPVDSFATLPDEAGSIHMHTSQSSYEQTCACIQAVILRLAQEGLIVIYEQPLALTPDAGMEDDILQKCITNEIARLLAHAKIDIQLDMTVKLTGDRRVLEDLKLLADTGYGEDRFGNNIPLPEKLSYLRK